MAILLSKAFAFEVVTCFEFAVTVVFNQNFLKIYSIQENFVGSDLNICILKRYFEERDTERQLQQLR